MDIPILNNILSNDINTTSLPVNNTSSPVNNTTLPTHNTSLPVNNTSLSTHTSLPTHNTSLPPTNTTLPNKDDGKSIFAVFHMFISILAVYLALRCNPKINYISIIIALFLPYPYVIYSIIMYNGICKI